jgi:hypothetical protein
MDKGHEWNIKAETPMYFNISWIALLIGIVAVPVAYLLIPDSPQMFEALAILIWGWIFSGAMGLISLLSGIVAGRTRRVALIWVIPLWFVVPILAFAGFYDAYFQRYLKGDWLPVIGYLVAFSAIILSILLMPIILNFPRRVKRVTYLAVSVLSVVLLIIWVVGLAA